ncbi:MAG: hypothetical protein ACQEXJ_13930 [Myxococcota bacterium]
MSPRLPPLLSALLLLGACGDGGEAARPDALGGEGASCDPVSPCEPALVCVDGTCVERPWPPDARPLPDLPDVGAPDVPDVADVGIEDADTADAVPEVTDAQFDLPDPGPDLPDPGPEVADADAVEVPDPGPDAPADVPADPGPVDADASLDADTDAAGPDTIVLLIREDEAGESLGSSLISLEPGQGWVTELTLPKAGELLGMEVILRNVSAPSSCGLFQPAVWLPDEAGDYEAGANWAAEPRILENQEEPYAFVFNEKHPVPQGKVRVGLVLAGSCDGEPPPPALATDATGNLARTFLWVPSSDGTPWVAGTSLGLDGRWALRALVEVPWP